MYTFQIYIFCYFGLHPCRFFHLIIYQEYCFNIHLVQFYIYCTTIARKRQKEVYLIMGVKDFSKFIFSYYALPFTSKQVVSLFIEPTTFYSFSENLFIPNNLLQSVNIFQFPNLVLLQLELFSLQQGMKQLQPLSQDYPYLKKKLLNNFFNNL